MTSSVRLLGGALLLLASLALAGCVPAPNASEEEKEAHFLAGKSHVSQMDYKGAIECFEKALEVNPQSASAHFELGCLYEQKEGDPAAAIYHYEHYLKLRPRAENRDIILQQVMACKQELARTVSLGPITEKQQRELEQLVEERRQLTEENRRLREELDKAQGHAARPQSLASMPVAGVGSTSNPQPSNLGQPSSTGTVALSGAGTPVRQASVLAATPRTHTVKQGETPTLIAKKYGLKVEALMAANPRLDARHLRVGQALSIP
ncbi:MAG TPA: LysM peptidoglycan-binding domain-containing protein [Candidatus Binatia bacterium]|jgi:tetratricopeptide (TPR) repeat protein|nr:LysM peptidoglycan-binding domain-containing protein [Candidatus Binatia bacterium]